MEVFHFRKGHRCVYIFFFTWPLFIGCTMMVLTKSSILGFLYIGIIGFSLELNSLLNSLKNKRPKISNAKNWTWNWTRGFIQIKKKKNWDQSLCSKARTWQQWSWPLPTRLLPLVIKIENMVKCEGTNLVFQKFSLLEIFGLRFHLVLLVSNLIVNNPCSL